METISGQKHNILNAIGNTPLVRLNHIVPNDCASIYAKLEYYNPTGAYKDRMAYAIISEATYQLPSVAIRNENDAVEANYTFKGMHRRRLSAEQFADAVSTVIYPVYHDTIKMFNPFKDVKSAIHRPYARASLVKNDLFLTALGRPNRENVSTTRSSQANLLQALELTNGDLFNSALDAGAKKWKAQFNSSEKKPIMS